MTVGLGIGSPQNLYLLAARLKCMQTYANVMFTRHSVDEMSTK